MAELKVCLGHEERNSRRNKIQIQKCLVSQSTKQVNENLRVLIKRGPISVETSLKELEENYASKAEWRVIEGGGVLSEPVEEFRMTKCTCDVEET